MQNFSINLLFPQPHHIGEESIDAGYFGNRSLLSAMGFPVIR